MPAFEERMAQAQGAIYGALGRRACVYRKAGGPVVEGIDAIVRNPTRSEQLRDAGLVMVGPSARIPVSQISALKQGDIIVRLATETLEADAWKVEEAPRRPDPGHFWEASVARVSVPA